MWLRILGLVEDCSPRGDFEKGQGILDRRHSSLDYEPRFPYGGERWIGEVPFLNRGRPPVTTGVLPSPFASGFSFPSNDVIADSMSMYSNLYRVNLSADSAGVSCSRNQNDRVCILPDLAQVAPLIAQNLLGMGHVCMIARRLFALYHTRA